jgi:hypothetical protein
MQLWFAGTAIIFPIEIVYERRSDLAFLCGAFPLAFCLWPANMPSNQQGGASGKQPLILDEKQIGCLGLPSIAHLSARRHNYDYTIKHRPNG